MRGMLNVMVVVCAISCMFVASAAFGAGGSITGNQLSGYFTLDGASQYNSSCYESEDDYVHGSFNLLLDGNSYSFEYANWSFYTNWYDTSSWTATCYMYGLREVLEEELGSQYWHQSVSQGGVDISASLQSNCYEPTYGDGLGVCSEPDEGGVDQDRFLGVNGSFNIKPADLQNSDFMYMEGYTQRWVDGGYEKVPTWTAQYTMYGRFIAPTLAEAQAMGAPYAAVPEPSSLAIMLGGVLISLATYLRRR